MAHHEIISEFLDIPRGYQTYSLLLLPDYNWSEKFGDPLLLLKTFARFGNIIGDRHMACWFYHSGRKVYAPLVDIEYFAALPANISTTNEEISVFIRRRAGTMSKHTEGLGGLRVDTVRSRLVCATLGLPYSASPYVAFFDKYPRLPAIGTSDFSSSDESFKLICEQITYPKLVLTMGALSLGGFIDLVDTLEQQIIRGDVRNKSIMWKRLRTLVTEWSERHRDHVISIIDKFATIAAKEAFKKL